MKIWKKKKKWKRNPLAKPFGENQEKVKRLTLRNGPSSPEEEEPAPVRWTTNFVDKVDLDQGFEVKYQGRWTPEKQKYKFDHQLSLNLVG